MGAKMYYRVLEDGNFVMEGTAKEIAKALNISYHSTVTQAAKRHSRMLWKYDVITIGRVEKKSPKQNEHQNRLEYLYQRLKFTGDTYLKEEPLEYVDELKEKGITFRWYPCFDGDGFHLERTK